MGAASKQNIVVKRRGSSAVQGISDYFSNIGKRKYSINFPDEPDARVAID